MTNPARTGEPPLNTGPFGEPIHRSADAEGEIPLQRLARAFWGHDAEVLQATRL